MTAASKNIYYDVLDDVVNKYNNTKHSTIKMKPIDVKNNKRVYIDEHNEKDSKLVNLKQVIVLEYLDIRIYLLKDMLLIGVVKYLLLIK